MYQNEKQKYEIKAVQEILYLFKMTKQSCDMLEQLLSCFFYVYLCDLGPLYTVCKLKNILYPFHLYNLKTHSSIFIDLENKITGPCTSISSHNPIKSFHLIIISREFIIIMHLISDD